MTIALASQTFGDGPPVVVLHGLLGSGTNWRSLARRLAEQHRVYLLDLRNHGNSPHAEGMSYAALAADVVAWMDRFGLQRASLVGHSMGGKTAMLLALQWPRRVERLCVVDIAPTPSDHDHRPVLDALLGVRLEGVTRRSEVDGQLRCAVPDAALRAFLLQNLVSDPQGWRWRLNLHAVRAALPDLLAFAAPGAGGGFDGPVLFIRGALSDYVGSRELASIRAVFPGARVETVADAGHWVHAEQPDAFLALLQPFLDEPPPDPATLAP